jgi:hypothetical protein
MTSGVIYDNIGRGYRDFRRPDPRIAAAIWSALASSVVNVGAGTGSYEPDDRELIAVEPSAVMIAQRPAHAAPAIQGAGFPSIARLIELLPGRNRRRDPGPPGVHRWLHGRVLGKTRGVPRRARARRRLAVAPGAPYGRDPGTRPSSKGPGRRPVGPPLSPPSSRRSSTSDCGCSPRR